MLVNSEVLLKLKMYSCDDTQHSEKRKICLDCKAEIISILIKFCLKTTSFRRDSLIFTKMCSNVMNNLFTKDLLHKEIHN